MKSINFDYSTNKNQMKTSHLHDFCEIYYQISGEKYYFIKNDTYYILPGDLVFIKENTLHKAFATNSNSNERMLLEINRDYLMYNISKINCSPLFDVFDEDIVVIRLEPKQQDIVKNIFKEMQIVFTTEKKESMDHLIIISLTLQFLLYIYQIRSRSKGQKIKISEQGFVNKRVVDITNYINQNYTNTLSLESLAKQFNISPFYLCKLFKNNIGFTFTDYLNTVRIKEAKQLLITTNFNITQISEIVGYTDVSYFGRIFKKVMNTTAHQFRRENK